ncbi:hypothetical protein GJU39_06290 [Pedobacter petrophilus]|uniref:Lrp/AsnC family transcriptional regulator n=1 Tax=Pedobacter petrophilus TaxID=1908241 RepID=A0A7K0FWG2_9SPHI|nr:hypothetical protein [Pedobacter petrophilus]MRX75692.1 hypothetical protein [Pedobacter petrophilus]
MNNYITIMYTNISREEQLSEVSACLSVFTDINDWTIDFGDIDKVLRISSRKEIDGQVSNALREVGLMSTVKEVFPC